MNTAQIIQAIDDLILTGGRRTTASNVRSLLNDFVSSYPNTTDGGNVFVAEVGYTTDLAITDDFSFVHKKWVEDNITGGGDLATTLELGNITDGNNIILSAFDILRGESTDFSLGFNNGSNFFVEYSNGSTSIYHSISSSKNQLGWTDGVDSSGVVYTGGGSNWFDTTRIYIDTPELNLIQLTPSTVPYIDASNNLISSTITPTELGYLTGASSPLQAQIDALVVGLSWKDEVKGATTTTLPSYTVSGGNKILTATSNGAFPVTDGLTYTVNESILIKDEVGGNAPNNGIYTITQVGTAGTPWILTRRNDTNTGSSLVSATVAISEGTTLADKQYVCNTDSPISLGVTNITFVAVGGTTYVGTTNRITVTGNIIDVGTDIVTLIGTQTLTNKRITRRVTTIISNATPTVNTDSIDMVDITALAVAITSMTTNLSGTPINGDLLQYQIKDNGTARAITWGASFEAKGQALPTTTTLGKRLNVLFSWDSTTSKWGCLDAIIET